MNFPKISTVVMMCLGSALISPAQTSPAPPPDSLETFRAEMRQLQAAVTEMKDQLAGSRRESFELRSELDALRAQLNPATQAAPDHVEEQEIVNAKVADLDQTKVESGSRYRVRLTGMVLLNVFSTRGSMDNLDLPKIASVRAPGESNGSFGATARQSLVSLGVSGPQWNGAKTSGEVNFDFFGGFPANPEGVTSGLVRLRTAKISLDWAHTSIVAGQDQMFISPLSPTSLASSAYPALASAGNLWTWTPQLRVEHRFTLSDTSSAAVQWGVLDPLTGEVPSEYNHAPTAGERSRIPAYAMRFGFQHKTHERLASIGAGAFYSRQNWGFTRNVDAWATSIDWDLPLGRWFSLSGEAYRGRSLGGLGGGFGQSVLLSGPLVLETTSVLPLESAGGWSQWKFKPLERLEFNAAFGEDYSYRLALPAMRNASGFVNTIYQPRSNLLFSIEYRRLWTSNLYDPKQVADHLSLSSGIIF